MLTHSLCSMPILELTAFWTYVPLVCQDLIDKDASVGWDADAVSFSIISVGFIGELRRSSQCMIQWMPSHHPFDRHRR